MNNDQLLGIITPTKPMLPIGFPTLPTSTSSSSKKKSSSSKSSKKDKVEAMWNQSYQHEMNRSTLNSMKVGISNEIYKIVKEDYGGELSDALKDERIGKLISGMNQQRAIMTANEQTLESNYSEYEKAKAKIEGDESGNKYAVNNYGTRYFKDQKGELRYEGQEGMTANSEGKKYKIEKASPFLTNNKLLEYNWNSLGYDESGRPKIADFGNSTDFSKNIAGDEIRQWLSLSSGKYNSINGNEGSSGNANLKTNINDVNQMVGALSEYMSPAARAQLNEEYWRQGFDQKLGLFIDVKEKGADGKVHTYRQPYYPTADVYKAIKEKEEAGEELTSFEKQVKDGKNVMSEDDKKRDFYGNVIRNYSNGVYSTLYSGGSGGSGGAGGDGVKLNYVASYAKKIALDPNAPSEKVTLYHEKKPAKFDNDGDMIEGATYEKEEFVIKHDYFSVENREGITKANEDLFERNTNEDGEYDAGRMENNGIHVKDVSNEFLFNGVVYNSDAFEGLVITKYHPELAVMPALERDQSGGKSRMLRGNKTQSGKENRPLTAAYRATGSMPATDENIEMMKATQIAEVGENDPNRERKDVVQAGDEIMDEWRIGTYPTTAAESLGISTQDVTGSTDGWFIDDNNRIVFDIYIEVPGDMNLQGGGTSKTYESNTGTFNAFSDYIKRGGKPAARSAEGGNANNWVLNQ